LSILNVLGLDNFLLAHHDER
jgi:hypothetical protein